VTLERKIREAVRLLERGLAWEAAELLRATVRCRPAPVWRDLADTPERDIPHSARGGAPGDDGPAAA
jgi:hypothetical protein